MSNDDYWYDVKEQDGEVVIKKLPKNKSESIDKTYTSKSKPKKEKESKIEPIYVVLGLIVFLPFITLITCLLISKYSNSTNNPNKYRTFMLYMVGSDLETTGSIATFDLKDIVGSKMDLDNVNVLVMAGGSKQWHNFVNENELGIYEVTKSGYRKVESLDLSSMGSSKTLSNFLNYVHNHYNSEKYDMIFWNHGLGSLGLEDDEVSRDYLDVSELNDAFKTSPFKEDKLELVIFNNCMSGNIHFASVMKNYAEYMVASEEVMYVGSNIDRLNFINDVEKDDDGYDIGLSYIKTSDESIRKLNVSSRNSFDSTLSIIDLSKIDDLEKSIDDYFETVDLNNNNYKMISRERRKTETYGSGDYNYDMVDLYTLTESLDNYASYNAKEKLQKSIKEAVVYNSALNNYSNGLSIYFPYYGSSEYVASHLYYFDKIWNNEYTEFINKYVTLSNSAKRANRAGSDDETLLLTNEIVNDNNVLSIELTNEEQEKYQNANIYVFDKINDSYNLLLKSDSVKLENNKLVFSDSKVLKTDNSITISSIYEKGVFKVYGNLDDSSVIVKISNENGYGTIDSVFADSNDKPIGGLLDYDDEIISFSKIVYKDLSRLSEGWNKEIEKEKINNLSNGINVIEQDLKNTYVLIEMFDENNDVFYSKLTEIK